MMRVEMSTVIPAFPTPAMVLPSSSPQNEKPIPLQLFSVVIGRKWDRVKSNPGASWTLLHQIYADLSSPPKQ
jgi:hypothetical protein